MAATKSIMGGHWKEAYQYLSSLSVWNLIGGAKETVLDLLRAKLQVCSVCCKCVLCAAGMCCMLHAVCCRLFLYAPGVCCVLQACAVCSRRVLCAACSTTLTVLHFVSGTYTAMH